METHRHFSEFLEYLKNIILNEQKKKIKNLRKIYIQFDLAHLKHSSFVLYIYLNNTHKN